MEERAHRNCPGLREQGLKVTVPRELETQSIIFKIKHVLKYLVVLVFSCKLLGFLYTTVQVCHGRFNDHLVEDVLDHGRGLD